MYNPKGKKVYEAVNKKNQDGFYAFNIKTRETDLTGNWSARMRVGNQSFNKTIKIETVVPSTVALSITDQTTNLKMTATQDISAETTECVPFYIFSDEIFTYDEAREYCRNLDLFMFNPHSNEDVTAMFSIGRFHENS